MTIKNLKKLGSDISVAVVTSSRADYGILKPLIKLLLNESWCEIRLIVIGSHFREQSGYTVSEILQDGVPIDFQLDTSAANDTSACIAEEFGSIVKVMTDYFSSQNVDLAVVLGDRVEILAVASAALISNTRVAHIHGGEATEGLIDDYARHAITKLSYFHFVSTDDYRRRVIQMGENESRVFNVGALSLDNLKDLEYASKVQICDDYGLDHSKALCICTYHPLTLDPEKSLIDLEAMLSALKNYDSRLSVIFTGVNQDLGSSVIDNKISRFARSMKSAYVAKSLGSSRYFQVVRIADFVIGNSSSAIIEAPSLGTVSINIGDRQRGRVKGNSIIDVEGKPETISECIEAILTQEHQSNEKLSNPYAQDGETAQKINEILKNINFKDLSLYKPFSDREVIL